MNPIVSMNSSTGIPLSTVTFLKACSDINCLAGAVCPSAEEIFSTQTAMVAVARNTDRPDPSFIVVSRFLDSLKLLDAPECGAIRLPLLLVVSIQSPQGASFPETALNRIDTIFFPHVAVSSAVRPFTPQTLLNLL